MEEQRTHTAQLNVPGVSWKDRLLIMAVILATSVFPVDLQPGAGQGPGGADGQFSGKQGEVLLITVPVELGSRDVTGHFLGRQIPFFPHSDSNGGHEYVGLLGIDMLDPPGTHEFLLKSRSGGEVRSLSYNVLVVPANFAVQRLTLPKGKVDLTPKNLVRVRAEQRQVKEVLSFLTEGPLWTQNFVEPVEGTVAGAFGRRRVINGQPRNPHSGEDISAPMGTKVVATNDGIVRVTVDHFFSGKGLFIDHGLGLHSMYFHLSEVLVKDGERVRRGQVIGRVGATGRATGPHLHWGIRLNGARVDPYSLTSLSLDTPISLSNR